jgi:hypothetical protein
VEKNLRSGASSSSEWPFMFSAGPESNSVVARTSGHRGLRWSGDSREMGDDMTELVGIPLAKFGRLRVEAA